MACEKVVVLPSEVVPAIKQTEVTLTDSDCAGSFSEHIELTEGQMSMKYLMMGMERKKPATKNMFPFHLMITLYIQTASVIMC